MYEKLLKLPDIYIIRINDPAHTRCKQNQGKLYNVYQNEFVKQFATRAPHICRPSEAGMEQYEDAPENQLLVHRATYTWFLLPTTGQADKLYRMNGEVRPDT